jgi:hypothetical protein
MRYRNATLIGSFFLAGVLAIPARGDTQPLGGAVPGTVNYVEGKVSIGSQPPDSKSIGSEALEAGQSITRKAGKQKSCSRPDLSASRQLSEDDFAEPHQH